MGAVVAEAVMTATAQCYSATGGTGHAVAAAAAVGTDARMTEPRAGSHCCMHCEVVVPVLSETKPSAPSARDAIGY